MQKAAKRRTARDVHKKHAHLNASLFVAKLIVKSNVQTVRQLPVKQNAGRLAACK